MSVKDSTILFGRSQHRTRQFLIFAVAILIISIFIYTPMAIGVIPDIAAVIFTPLLIALGGSMVNAYLNDGLLISTLITIAVALGVILSVGLWAILGIMPPDITPAWGALILLLPLPFIGVGVGAFIVGAGARRVVSFIG